MDNKKIQLDSIDAKITDLRASLSNFEKLRAELSRGDNESQVTPPLAQPAAVSQTVSVENPLEQLRARTEQQRTVPKQAQPRPEFLNNSEVLIAKRPRDNVISQASPKDTGFALTQAPLTGPASVDDTTQSKKTNNLGALSTPSRQSTAADGVTESPRQRTVIEKPLAEKKDTKLSWNPAIKLANNTVATQKIDTSPASDQPAPVDKLSRTPSPRPQNMTTVSQRPPRSDLDVPIKTPSTPPVLNKQSSPLDQFVARQEPHVGDPVPAQKKVSPLDQFAASSSQTNLATEQPVVTPTTPRSDAYTAQTPAPNISNDPIQKNKAFARKVKPFVPPLRRQIPDNKTQINSPTKMPPLSPEKNTKTRKTDDLPTNSLLRIQNLSRAIDDYQVAEQTLDRITKLIEHYFGNLSDANHIWKKEIQHYGKKYIGLGQVPAREYLLRGIGILGQVDKQFHHDWIQILNTAGIATTIDEKDTVESALVRVLQPK